MGGSFDDVTNAIGGVNYYIDAIGFGASTGIAKAQGKTNRRMGLRYFMNTGMKCSNGKDMYEYIDNIPKGLGGRAGEEISKSMGVKLQGLAPGIVEDAASALNPMRLFNAAVGTGYARCKKVSLPVGDDSGRIKSSYDETVWVEGPVMYRNGIPHQTQWVYDADISQEVYENTPKEGFASGGPGVQTIAAGVLLTALAVGVALLRSRS
jgi:hypothetical protein